jgi:hypothetical protein
MIRIVNMIPPSLSGETGQDSEPNLAVNPQRPTDMVATAFTPAPLGGSLAPIYVSTDGGATWSLRTVLPENGQFGTSDVTVGFATTGGMLYAGILGGTTSRLKILRTQSFGSTTPMTVLVDRADEDQPWVVAGSVVAAGTSRDRVFVGSNSFGQTASPEATAVVDLSADAAAGAPPSGFATHQLERRPTGGQDGPPIRVALHAGGTVYAAFQRWVTISGSDVRMDVVITRDDDWGSGPDPFGALVDSADNVAGQRIATDRFVRFNDSMGQERLGSDLAIAVDPADERTVYVAWCDRVGGPSATDWTLHVRRSTDGGQSWSADLRTVTNAKNPALAVDARRRVGLAYQQFTGARWATSLEVTTDAWAGAATIVRLHTAPSNVPARSFFPYIGDYIRLLAVGSDFYGVFSANNTPDMANFPSGVTYQRAADFSKRTLLSTDRATPVAVSIDPFFFHWSDAAEE